MSAGDVVEVGCRVEVGYGDVSGLALRVAVADQPHVDIDPGEALTANGQPIDLVEAPDGSRLGAVVTDGSPMTISYQATCRVGEQPLGAPLVLGDVLHWTAPSRYCPSDATAGFAVRHFTRHPDAGDTIREVRDWVREHIEYLSGASQVTTTAVETLISAAGVCRDFAHLTISLLRGLDIPARYVAVYAPGLQPPDFHALVEAHSGEGWLLVDPTGLSDPNHALRIATGRDGADVAFLTNLSGNVPLLDLQVWAHLVEQEAGAA